MNEVLLPLCWHIRNERRRSKQKEATLRVSLRQTITHVRRKTKTHFNCLKRIRPATKNPCVSKAIGPTKKNTRVMPPAPPASPIIHHQKVSMAPLKVFIGTQLTQR